MAESTTPQSRLTYTTPPGQRCSLCPEPAVFHVYRSGGGVAEADACEEHKDEVIKNLTVFPRWSRISGGAGYGDDRKGAQ